MKRPHLPDFPRRFEFRIRPFHVTLAAVVIVHLVAFYLFFSGGEPGGSAPASSVDRSVERASVTWQHIDSMVPDLESEVAAVSEAPEVTARLLQDPVSVPEVTTPAVVPVPAVPPVSIPTESSVEEVDGIPVSETVPIRAATVVADTTGSAPATPTSGEGRGFGEGANAGFDFGAYDLLITKEFHQAWIQPLGVDTPFRKNAAKLLVTIGRSGKVERFSLVRLTGVPELDSSVLAAARSVRRIAALPESYHGDTYDVMINFQLD